MAKIKSIDGELLYSIYKRPFYQGMSRRKIRELFIEKTDMFNSDTELRKKIRQLMNKKLVSRKIVNGETFYLTSDNTLDFLIKNGYLDDEEARRNRRKELMNEMLDFDKSGSLIQSRKNYDSYLRIQQIIFKEFYKKFATIETIEKNLYKAYENAELEDLEHEIDLLVYNVVNGNL